MRSNEKPVDFTQLPLEAWNSLGFRDVIKIQLVKDVGDGYFQFAYHVDGEWKVHDLSYVVRGSECFSTEEGATKHRLFSKLAGLGRHRLKEKELLEEVETLQKRYYELNSLAVAEYNKKNFNTEIKLEKSDFCEHELNITIKDLS